MTSPSSDAAPREASNHDELYMQQSLLFSDTLKELKNLREQLYGAAEYFEISYNKEEQKQIVVESLKDYTIKALINTVDHLGSVAYKVNFFLDEKIGKVSETELRFHCMERRLQTCQEFINRSGLSQQAMVIKTPRHHKRYIFPDFCMVGETMDVTGQSKSKYHSSSLSVEDNSHQFKNAAQATTREPPSSRVRAPHFSGFSSRQDTLFTRISANKKPEKQATSPLHFPLLRSGSFLKRSTSPNYSNNVKWRYPSEPRRSVSLSGHAERDRTKDVEQYPSKSKRLFKALLSMSKSRKDGTLYKFLDEN